jgi:hypothetical protein
VRTTASSGAGPERPAVALAAAFVALEQAAVDPHPAPAGFEQVAGAGHGVRRTEEPEGQLLIGQNQRRSARSCRDGKLISKTGPPELSGGKDNSGGPFS